MRSALRHAFALVIVGCLAGACDHWPGVDDNPNGGGYPVGSSATGTCSGTPIPCASLGGDDCAGSPGCSDQGSCAGTSTMPTQPCGTALSFQSCSGIAGCFWNAACVGTPLGSCTGATESTCLLAKGCVFTPASSVSGSGGSSSGLCTTFGQTCASAGNCDCGFACVKNCASCRATCGTPCISDGDCTGSMGSLGTATPYCVGVPSPPTDQYTGVCASSR